MKKKEFYYLDIIKFIAIIMVCSYHFPLICNIDYCQQMNFSTYTTRFLFDFNSMCIPLFFLVNGALLLNKEVNIKLFIKKIINIILQLIIWRTITIIIIGTFNNINLLGYGKNYLFNAILFGNFKGIVLNHFWFISDLIAIYLIFPFIKKEYDELNNKPNDKNYIPIFLLILFIICFLANDINTISRFFCTVQPIRFLNITTFNPFAGIVGAMLFYFIAGGYIHKNIDKFKAIKLWKLLLIFIIFSLILLYKWTIESKLNKSTWDAVFGGYDTVPCLFMSISFFIIIAKLSTEKIENHKSILYFLRVVGNNTLTVYYTHLIFGLTLFKLIKNRLYYGICTNLLKAILIVITFSFIGQGFKRAKLFIKNMKKNNLETN